ncbi:MAG: hypothetical protein RDV48_04485 [Candidatus Eremiobacteraeota bacterium]|nr:hypothetical protein [Candidatus Eremiobacteraeota bacterium]
MPEVAENTRRPKAPCSRQRFDALIKKQYQAFLKHDGSGNQDFSYYREGDEETWMKATHKANVAAEAYEKAQERLEELDRWFTYRAGWLDAMSYADRVGVIVGTE